MVLSNKFRVLFIERGPFDQRSADVHDPMDFYFILGNRWAGSSGEHLSREAQVEIELAPTAVVAGPNGAKPK